MAGVMEGEGKNHRSLTERLVPGKGQEFLDSKKKINKGPGGVQMFREERFLLGQGMKYTFLV